MLFRLGLIMAIGGGVLGYFGLQEYRLASSASATPEEITLKNLIARGPEGNPHVRVKEFLPCQNFIYESTDNSTVWNKVWIPVIVLDLSNPVLGGEQLKPNKVQALIKSSRIKTEREIETVMKPEGVQATVTNKIESLGSEEQKKLQESYPGTDFSKCLILEEGRQPASSSKVLLMGGGGLALLVGGLLILYFGAIKRRAF
jgi:hypothetical protein